MELVRESFYLPPPPALPMRQYLSCWVKEPRPSQSLWGYPFPGKQAYGSLQGEGASGHCIQAWTSEWKDWTLHSTEQSSSQFSAQKLSLLCQSSVVPSLPRISSKAILLSAPHCKELKIRIRIGGCSPGPVLERLVNRSSALKIPAMEMTLQSSPNVKETVFVWVSQAGNKKWFYNFFFFNVSASARLLQSSCYLLHHCSSLWGGTGRAALLFNHSPSLLTCG